METTNLFAEERKRDIVAFLEERGKVTVGELCHRFEVSGATIRNDLRELETLRRITRVHGGAMRRDRVSEEVLVDHRSPEPDPAKEEIARLALNQVDNGDTIIVDTGTTCTVFAGRLPEITDLTVITNDLRIALALEEHDGIRIVVVGGRVRNGYHCTVEPFSSPWEEISADKAFLGVNGFALAKGAMTPDMGQANAKKEMIRAASKAILLCDSSKFEKNSVFRFAEPEAIDLLITDDLPKDYAGELDSLGIEYLSAKGNKP